ncbi:MAG: glycosyltransferase, partial [Pyrinomonadaceae bacterium]
MMKISVAMCTYNGGRYLGEQLASIAWQTRPPDELLVCDDLSSDDSREIVSEFAARAPFSVRLLVNETNLGSTKNFERAIDLCAGDVIALADQDDIWCREKLARMEQVFAFAPEIGLVFSDGELVDERSNRLGRRVWQSLKFTEFEQKSFANGK